MIGQQERPYVVCHILSSIDGRISGEFMDAPETKLAAADYARLRSLFDCEALLYGTTTMIESYGRVEKAGPHNAALGREDVIAPHDGRGYIIAIDPMGEIDYSSSTLTRSGKTDAHVIALMCEDAPADSVDRLVDLGLSCVFAGKGEIDLEKALRKLLREFGIDRVMLAGGGATDYCFLKDGLIDEVSLVVTPVVSGDRTVATSFDSSSAEPVACALELAHVEKLESGAIWQVYKKQASTFTRC